MFSLTCPLLLKKHVSCVFTQRKKFLQLQNVNYGQLVKAVLGSVDTRRDSSMRLAKEAGVS